jgi:zinc transporter ZupT
MFMGSLLAFNFISSEDTKLMTATQLFSAGILIAALGVKLAPQMLNSSTGLLGSACIFAGGFAGIAMMVCLERIADAEDVDDHDDYENMEDGKIELLVGEHNTNTKRKPVPWRLAIPIFVDSWMDGLLIGVVLLVSHHAAGIMALATTFEMGFLGISFGALLKPCGWKKWPVALLAPTMLVSGGIAGVCVADTLNSNPAFFGGVIAFGSSAIFIVTKELLQQAYENIGKGDRHLSILVFVGFFSVIISERLFPDVGFL